MSFPKLQITEAGKVALINALSGGSLVFTSIKAGNGEAPENIFNLTELQNPLLNLNINSIEQGDGCVSLEAAFDNANIEAGFHWSEIGVFVEDGENSEVLYAYAHAGEHAEYIPQYSDTSFLKTTINVVVAVGDAENITAILGEYSGYAGKEEFDDHVANIENPHEVTAEQIGLGNVENVSVNDATPTYADSSTLSTLTSGERLSIAFGKIKKAISSLISHLSASNPHNITVGKIGAAKITHTHSANDVIKGVLGIERGGTGASSSKSALDNLTKNNDIILSQGKSLKVTDLNGNLMDLIKFYIINTIISNDKGTIFINAKDEVSITADEEHPLHAKVWVFRKSGAFTPDRTADYFTIGESSTPVQTVYCHNVITSSDIKNKENITDCKIGLELLKRLSFKEFNYIGSDKTTCGLIAQEVFEILQSIGVENSPLYSAVLKDDSLNKQLTDEEIKATDDSLIEWGLNYTLLTNYCLAGFKEFYSLTNSRLDYIEKKLKEVV